MFISNINSLYLTNPDLSPPPQKKKKKKKMKKCQNSFSTVWKLCAYFQENSPF